MERSEPSLVPEWLRCSGNGSGGNNTTSSPHHFVSSSIFPGSRSFRGTSDKDSLRGGPPALRNNSLNSNNGSAKHPYSSFTRSHRDRNREKDKERSGLGLWDHPHTHHQHDNSDPLDSILSSRTTDKNILRRTQSMISRKTEDPRRNKDFDKDFPSLGSEVKHSSISRVPSPVLNLGISGEKWTSALAEVPEVPSIITINGLSKTNSNSNSSTSPVSAVTSGLNMAEALSQAPLRARTAPQVADKTQRLEELAIKQSRQLIPMVGNSCLDKAKQQSKVGVRNSEVSVGPTKQVNRQVKPSSSSSSVDHVGKFLVLKPVRDAKESNGHGHGSGEVGPPSVTPTTSPKVSSSAVNNNNNLVAEKKSSQAQSRSDFFNMMRKKTSTSVTKDNTPPKIELEKSSDEQVVNSTTQNGGSGGEVVVEEEETKRRNSDDKMLYLPDKEEEAFLRTLGWDGNDENPGEDEGLTQEEISAFYQEYMKLLPSLKLWRGNNSQEMKCVVTTTTTTTTTTSGDASSASSSSGSGF